MLPGIDEDDLAQRGLGALTPEMGDALIAAVTAAYEKTQTIPTTGAYIIMDQKTVYACPIGALALQHDPVLLSTMRSLSRPGAKQLFWSLDGSDVMQKAGLTENVLHHGLVDGFDQETFGSFLGGPSDYPTDDEYEDLMIVYAPGYELGRRLRIAFPDLKTPTLTPDQLMI